MSMRSRARESSDKIENHNAANVAVCDTAFRCDNIYCQPTCLDNRADCHAQIPVPAVGNSDFYCEYQSSVVGLVFKILAVFI